MDKDLITPTTSNVRPFLHTVRGAKPRSQSYVKLDIDAGKLEAGLRREMTRWGSIARLQKFIRFHFWLIAAVVALIISAFMAHFWSLNIITEVAHTDPSMSYGQMVEYHNEAARKAGHLSFASNVSIVFAAGLTVYIAIRASIQKGWMKS